MAVDIPNSVGYEGSIDETQWAHMMAYVAGRQYGVVGTGDWAVSAGTSDREVRIAPGSGFGSGVLDRTTQVVSLTLPAPAAGSQWYLIAVRRSWQTNKSSFIVIPGASSVQPGTFKPAIPSRETTVGLTDDQPIALAYVGAGQAQVSEMRDLRVWGGAGGATAASDLVLDYMTRLGTQISIYGTSYRREMGPEGNPVWLMHGPQGGQLETVTSGGIANKNALTHLALWRIPQAVSRGSLLHIRADVEIYIPDGPDYAGYTQIMRGDDNPTVLAQRRWHNQRRTNRFIYPSVELNLPVTQEIPANTAFRFSMTSDPLSAGGVEVWHAFVSWGVS